MFEVLGSDDGSELVPCSTTSNCLTVSKWSVFLGNTPVLKVLLPCFFCIRNQAELNTLSLSCCKTLKIFSIIMDY